LKTLIGFKKAGPLKKPLLFWTCEPGNKRPRNFSIRILSYGRFYVGFFPRIRRELDCYTILLEKIIIKFGPTLHYTQQARSQEFVMGVGRGEADAGVWGWISQRSAIFTIFQQK